MENYDEFSCIDCDINTLYIGEYYMVHDDVWIDEAGMEKTNGMLCIGCLETRIKRELSRLDFTDYPINTIAQILGSQRIQARLEF